MALAPAFPGRFLRIGFLALWTAGSVKKLQSNRYIPVTERR